MIADSNHGYKMIGVGKLVAEELLNGESALLAPFRFSRFTRRVKLHPVSQQPVSRGADRKFQARAHPGGHESSVQDLERSRNGREDRHEKDRESS